MEICSLTREAEMPLRTNHVHKLWGNLKQEPMRSKVQGRDTYLSQRWESLKDLTL